MTYFFPSGYAITEEIESEDQQLVTDIADSDALTVILTINDESQPNRKELEPIPEEEESPTFSPVLGRNTKTQTPENTGTLRKIRKEGESDTEDKKNTAELEGKFIYLSSI